MEAIFMMAVVANAVPASTVPRPADRLLLTPQQVGRASIQEVNDGLVSMVRSGDIFHVYL